MGDILFSGDTILGEGTAVIAPPDGSLADYLASLTRLRNLDITRIFPGHWRTVIAAQELIDYYLAHRAERHSSILSSLTGRGLSIDEIVARVYTDTPSELHPIAKWSVMAHLEMAMYEGQVVRVGQRWRRMDRG